MKDKNIRIDVEVWELLRKLAKRQNRTIKKTIKVLVEEANELEG